MERPLKVARPVVVLTATAVAPLRLPLPGLLWMAKVTVWAVPVTVFPLASWRVTTGCVPNAAPAVELLGLVVNASLFAGPGLKVTVTVREPLSSAKVQVVLPVRQPELVM